MASVEIKNVTKIYDNGAKAVDNVSLKIQHGEFIVLVGPSGCGKSTLLRMIAGLEEISEGTIAIGKTVVNNVPAKDRNIAMVFQNYALYPHMTVYENMAFGLKLRKFAKQDIEERVNEAAEILDLKAYLDRKPKQLSGGQRQRVAVGRAIVRKPDVFLFDEPLSNLDAKLRVQMRLEISKLHKKLKTTMVYVTHDQVEAMTMGDRIVVVNNGQVLQYDRPLDVYNKPVNRFVAGFIGSPAMNFIEGTIRNEGNLLFEMDNNSFRLPVPDKSEPQFKPGRVSLGFRPEQMKFLQESSADGITLNATVEVVEPMGNELFVHLKTGQSKLTMRCAPDYKIAPGDNIQFYVEQENCHFFDSETGDMFKI